MTDEHEHAMKVWREACGESQEAFYRIGEQPNDPESIKQGQLADQAAAAVIAADRAGLVAEVERLRRNVRGWVEWHRRCDADDACTYLNDNAWCDAEALASTGMGLLARAALKEPSHEHG